MIVLDPKKRPSIVTVANNVLDARSRCAGGDGLSEDPAASAAPSPMPPGQHEALHPAAQSWAARGLAHGRKDLPSDKHWASKSCSALKDTAVASLDESAATSSTSYDSQSSAIFGGMYNEEEVHLRPFPGLILPRPCRD